jgi:hypothetical protein
MWMPGKSRPVRPNATALAMVWTSRSHQLNRDLGSLNMSIVSFPLQCTNYAGNERKQMANALFVKSLRRVGNQRNRVDVRTLDTVMDLRGISLNRSNG